MEKSQNKIKPGVYTHFKGLQCFVHGVAQHTETEEEFVVYEELGDEPKLWIRPVAMFLEDVEFKGQKVARFKYDAEA